MIDPRDSVIDTLGRKRPGLWGSHPPEAPSSSFRKQRRQTVDSAPDNMYMQFDPMAAYMEERNFFASMGFPVHLHSREPFQGSGKFPSSCIGSYAGFSMAGYYPHNTARENQDSLLMMEEPRTNSVVFVCMDGHGTYGHKVSKFVRSFLQEKLFTHELFQLNIKKAITEVLLDMEHALYQIGDGVAETSGTTLAMAVVRGNHVTVANVGDSRAVLVKSVPSCISDTLSAECLYSSKSEGDSSKQSTLNLNFPATDESSEAEEETDGGYTSGDSGVRSRTTSDSEDSRASDSVDQSTYSSGSTLSAVSLTVDHKPDRVEEYNRILSSGGRVFSIRYADGIVGPPRVWQGDSNSPGLAMSRSIGDLKIQTAGVVSTPDIFEYEFDTSQDCMLVLATDGLWDKISNEEVAQIAAMQPGPNRAVASLVNTARMRWLSNDRMSDDVSVCVAFLRGIATIEEERPRLSHAAAWLPPIC